jgi:DNA-binding NtrC family response regulator
MHLDFPSIVEIDSSAINKNDTLILTKQISCIIYVLDENIHTVISFLKKLSQPVIGIVLPDQQENLRKIPPEIFSFTYHIDFHIDYAFLNILINQIIHQYKMYNQIQSEEKSAFPVSLDMTYPLPGNSHFIMELNKRIEVLAFNDIPILITGPTGTGKSTIARMIHYLNPKHQSSSPVELDCHAINMNLIESELFGYEKGAFTGAIRSREGRFVEAHQSTLILEEISGLSPELQGKLLHVLDTKRFTPLGSSKEIVSDFRLISTTNQNLENLIATSKIRLDFYYRINAIRIDIPPFSKRREDIFPFFILLVKKECEKSKIEIPEFSPGFVAAVEEYEWPGNLKEMQNVIRQLLLLRPSVLTREMFEFTLVSTQIPEMKIFTQNVLPLEELKTVYIRYMEANFNYTKKELAEKLGIDYKTLKKYLKGS